MTEQVALALENSAINSLNYFERLVDADGLPYFNVFWTEPAEAAHDPAELDRAADIIIECAR